MKEWLSMALTTIATFIAWLTLQLQKRMNARATNPHGMPHKIQDALAGLPNTIGTELEGVWESLLDDLVKRLGARPYKERRRVARQILANAYLAFIRSYSDRDTEDRWKQRLEKQVDAQFADFDHHGFAKKFWIRLELRFGSSPEGRE